MSIDLDKLEVEVRLNSYLRRIEPDEWIANYQASVYNVSEEGPKELEVARANILLLDGYLGLSDEGTNLLEACDAHSQELLEVYETLFDEEGELRPPLNDAMCPLIWYFDYLIVRPGFRGQGLGKELVEWILVTLCRDQGVALVLPVPLELQEFEAEHAELLVLEDEDLRDRVKHFWEGLHFFPLNGTQYWFRNLELKPGVPSLNYESPWPDNVVNLFTRRGRRSKKR